MVEESPIIRTLRELDEDRTPPEIPEIAGRKILDRTDRVEAAFDLKMRGHSNTVIAEILGVDKTTVGNYLKEYIEKYKSTLEQETPLNLVSESILFFENIRQVCLHEASQCEKGKELEERKRRTNDPDKLKWTKMAHDAELSRLKLMMDVGIIPKEPDRMYQILKNDKEAEKLAESSRAPEIIRDNIKKLMTRVKPLV